MPFLRTSRALYAKGRFGGGKAWSGRGLFVAGGDLRAADSAIFGDSHLGEELGCYVVLERLVEGFVSDDLLVAIVVIEMLRKLIGQVLIDEAQEDFAGEAPLLSAAAIESSGGGKPFVGQGLASLADFQGVPVLFNELGIEIADRNDIDPRLPWPGAPVGSEGFDLLEA